jgi:hypothetical protein
VAAKARIGHDRPDVAVEPDSVALGGNPSDSHKQFSEQQGRAYRQVPAAFSERKKDMLVLDGVYAKGDGQPLRFYRLPPPSDAGVAQVGARVAGRIARLLQRRGLGPEAAPEETESLIRNETLLAALYGASVSGRTATGPRAGMRVTTVGD